MTCLFFSLIRTVLCSFVCFSIAWLSSSCDDEIGSPPIRAEYSMVTTVAGNGTSGFQDGVGSLASFNHPAAMVVDDAGNLYVSDHQNHSIRKVTPRGEVSTFAG